MSFEGYMGKRGGVDGKAQWRRRWFVLQGPTLSYYAKKGDANPRGSLSLTEAYLVSSSAQRRPLCFQVVCPERTYYFEPDDPAVRKQWIQSIRAAMPAEASQRPRLFHSGALMKLGGKAVGGKKTKWQRRFCCVQDGELVYYLRPRNMFPPEKRQGNISLVESTLVEKLGERSHAFEIRSGGKVYSFNVPPPAQSTLRRASHYFQYKEDEKQLELEEQADAEEQYAQWITAISLGIPSKVFGVPFDVALQRSRTSTTQMVPEPLLMAIQWLNQNALQEEGLYRIPGSKAEIEKFIVQYDSGKAVAPPPQNFFGGNLASLIVQFLKQCPESLFSDQYSQVFEQITAEFNLQKLPKHLVMMKKLLTMIPPVNLAIIRFLGEHLLAVAKFSDQNQMTLDKLAMCVYTRMSLTLQVCLENFDFLFGQDRFSLDVQVEQMLKDTIRRVTIAHAPKYDAEGDSDEEEEKKLSTKGKEASDSE